MMKKVFSEFIVLIVYGLRLALGSFIAEDYHYYSGDEDELNQTQQPELLNRFICPPPFPDLLHIFKPSLQESGSLSNTTRNLIKSLLADDCETFAPLFNDFLSEFNSDLCPFHNEHSTSLKTDNIIENAVASTCPHPDLSDEEWGKKTDEFDGDWKKKRAGRKDTSQHSNINTYHSHVDSSVYKGGEVGDSIGYKAIGGMHNGGEHEELYNSNAVYNHKDKDTMDPTQDHMVSHIQRVGLIILVVVFVSVLIAVLLVVAVLAWVRNKASRSFVQTHGHVDDKSDGHHWYDATANKESYLMEQRGGNQAVKQYL